MCAAQVVCSIQGVQHTWVTVFNIVLYTNCGVSDRTVYKRCSLYKGYTRVHSTQDGV